MRHVSVPLYKGLGINDIAAFLSNGHRNLYNYLPDRQEIRKVPKEWTCNVIATVLGGVFTGWVRNRIEERNEAVKEQKDLNIDMDPELAAVYQASTKTSRKYLEIVILLHQVFFSVSKGASANMMKAGTKRRRTKAQIKQDKADALLEEAENHRRLAELAELQAKVGLLEQEAANGKAAS